MIGFDIKENFNLPYVADSITDFWRRWHISLGAWMRNYLYIPLGGNRVASKWRLYFNLWLVFLASGLWHGASWNFIIWGAYHGFWLVAERALLLKLFERIWNPVRVAFAFFIVVIGWVFFRIETLEGAITCIGRLFAFNAGKLNIPFTPELIFYFSIAALFSFMGLTGWGQKLTTGFYHTTYSGKAAVVWGTACLSLLILDISILASKGFNPFIYFRF